MNLLFFDANFLFYTNVRFNNTITKKLKESNFAIFTSELVVLEGKNKNIREISELYKKYKSFMSDEKLKMYINLNEHAEFDEDKVKKESNRKIDSYIKEYFGDNIIDSVDDDEIGKILLGRYQLKQPPFINSENSSDKGWKDTLIWVSFMRYCINKDYENFYFISKDKGFLNQQESLKEEFSKMVGKAVVFINPDSFDDLFVSLGISKKKKKNDKQIQIPDNIREEIIASIDEFTEYDEVYNSFGDSAKNNAFSFAVAPSIVEIEKFCNLLNEAEPSFAFMKTINLNEIVSKCFFLATTNCTFTLNEIRTFLKSWNIILNDYPNYKTYFLNALELKFSNSVQSQSQSSSSDDLPF